MSLVGRSVTTADATSTVFIKELTGKAGVS